MNYVFTLHSGIFKRSLCTSHHSVIRTLEKGKKRVSLIDIEPADLDDEDDNAPARKITLDPKTFKRLVETNKLESALAELNG